MKIHTNVLSATDLLVVLAETTTGVHFDRLDVVGSRSRAVGLDIALESDGTPDQDGNPRRRCRNRGKASNYDGHPGFAASYDDWGRFIAGLYVRDTDAIVGPYKDEFDFHAQTRGAYLRADSNQPTGALA